MDDVIKLILERTELNDFLSVPAPDILHENAFWHDENDKPIECNIYHPKYGYLGFETITKDHIIASFNPITVYQDARTGKYIHCRYYLQMLCTADEKNFTNKDGEKVIKVAYLQTHLKRLAENEQDFELIYQREFASRKLTDTPEMKTVFCKELINHIQELIGLHEKRSNYKEGRDIKVLALANRFIDYINVNMQQQKQVNIQLIEINKAHLSRCFFEMVSLLNGNTTDKTAIAKFYIFLLMEKKPQREKNIKPY